MRFLVIAILLVIFDQATKLATKGFNLFGIKHEGMRLGESHEIIGDFLRFTFVENPGMAFGISFGWGKIFLSLFSILAAIGLVWYLLKLRPFNTWVQFGIALMLAGAVGNLIDRVFYGVFYGEAPLFYGKVVDFIDVNLPDISLGAFELSRFWVFNIADSCVTCGVIVLLFVHDKIPTWDELKAGRYFKKEETQIISEKPAHEASF
jgi:signal peptidase II